METLIESGEVKKYSDSPNNHVVNRKMLMNILENLKRLEVSEKENEKWKIYRLHQHSNIKVRYDGMDPNRAQTLSYLRYLG